MVLLTEKSKYLKELLSSESEAEILTGMHTKAVCSIAGNEKAKIEIAWLKEE